MDMATMPSRQLILRRRGYALEKGQATPASSSALLPPGCGTHDGPHCTLERIQPKHD